VGLYESDVCISRFDVGIGHTGRMGAVRHRQVVLMIFMKKRNNCGRVVSL
jgi:hypothetical protein